MGTQLNQDDARASVRPIQSDVAGRVSNVLRLQVPWLERESAQTIAAIIGAVAAEHLAFRAAVLYGSVARHEERPLDDLAPSDVDVLLLFVPGGTQRDLTFEEHRAIFASIGHARMSMPEPPRDIQVVPVALDLREWDETFVANVARDGILLFARGELPPSLASVTERAAPLTTVMPFEADSRC